MTWLLFYTLCQKHKQENICCVKFFTEASRACTKMDCEVSSSQSSHFHFAAFNKILKMYYRHCKIGSMFFKKIYCKVNYIKYHSDLTGRMS